MIHLIRKLSQPLVWRFYKWYLYTPKWYKYDGIEVRILPTVFHPGWLVSTKTLLNFIAGFELNGKKILELGAGSGLIALYASRQGATTTATDINPMAIKAMKESAHKNNLQLTIIESDLFEKIEPREFNYIFINPPYFPKDPIDNWERAFYCGANFEYFHKLFAQLHPYLGNKAKTYMILSEYCNIEVIHTLAARYSLTLELLQTKVMFAEEQYIYIIDKVTKPSN